MNEVGPITLYSYDDSEDRENEQDKGEELGLEDNALAHFVAIATFNAMYEVAATVMVDKDTGNLRIIKVEMNNETFIPVTTDT